MAFIPFFSLNERAICWIRLCSRLNCCQVRICHPSLLAFSTSALGPFVSYIKYCLPCCSPSFLYSCLPSQPLANDQQEGFRPREYALEKCRKPSLLRARLGCRQADIGNSAVFKRTRTGRWTAVLAGFSREPEAQISKATDQVKLDLEQTRRAFTGYRFRGANGRRSSRD
jgi:hypothetical protein